jgi:hypothetical protein
MATHIVLVGRPELDALEYQTLSTILDGSNLTVLIPEPLKWSVTGNASIDVTVNKSIWHALRLKAGRVVGDFPPVALESLRLLPPIDEFKSVWARMTNDEGKFVRWGRVA